MHQFKHPEPDCATIQILKSCRQQDSIHNPELQGDAYTAWLVHQVCMPSSTFHADLGSEQHHAAADSNYRWLPKYILTQSAQSSKQLKCLFGRHKQNGSSR